MKFQIRCKHLDRDGKVAPTGDWWEPYDEPEVNTQEDAETWAKVTLERFNSTLRPNEFPRELLEVQLIGKGEKGIKHKWEKSNLVSTVGYGGSIYDTYRCAVCGITGRRHGTSEYIVRDTQYKAKKYQYCKTTGRD